VSYVVEKVIGVLRSMLKKKLFGNDCSG